jgi:hypothetical protein
VPSFAILLFEAIKYRQTSSGLKNSAQIYLPKIQILNFERVEVIYVIKPQY